MPSRHVTAEYDPRERYVLMRLCDCPTCEGKGKAFPDDRAGNPRCPDCRGEGRQRQELTTCATPEELGVALVTLGREGEFADCPIGVLDRGGEVGQKWLVRPWTPSARNVTDAARTLARSKKASQSS